MIGMRKVLIINLILNVWVLCSYALPTNNLCKEPISDTISREEYAKYLAQYNKGERKPTFLRNLAETASLVQDDKNAKKIGNDYIRQLKEPYTSEELVFIQKYTTQSSDPGFMLFYKHPEKVDAVLGMNSSINKVKSIIYGEEIQPYLNSNTDWDKVESKVVTKYGTAGEEIFLRAKTLDYFNKGNIEKFIESAVPYVKKYGERVPLFELNNYAWEIFQKVKDPDILEVALGWSKMTLQEKDAITFLDTYANLLYKLGRKEEAISTEEHAVSVAGKNEKVEFQANLEKMKKGENTWK